MITKENIEDIQENLVIFDDVLVSRRLVFNESLKDGIFDLFKYDFIEKSHIFTGNAEAVAKYLNNYFDLKEG